MPRRLRLLRPFLCPLGLGTQLRADDLAQQLHDQYQGRIFVLRGFPSGEKQHYDASAATEHSSPGTWTRDGFFLIDDMKVEGQNLTSVGRQMLVVSRGTGCRSRICEPMKWGEKLP